MNKLTLGDVIFNIILYTFLVALGIATIYPFINVLAISFNESLDTVAGGIYLLPRKFTLHNYAEIMRYPNLMTGFVNSVLRTVIGTALGVLFTSMFAFTISRKEFIGAKLFSTLFAITMYVSGGLIPSYILAKNLGLTNNFLVYILPAMIWAFCIFIIRSYIDSLPISLQESAMLDGANDVIIFFRIIFPLCMPVLATTALFYAVGQWNSWFDNYLYNGDNKSLTTLQFELQKILANATFQKSNSGGFDAEYMRKANFVTPESLQMAITVIATVPILFVYPFLQKYFIKGMTLGAVKA